jgi:hypothetical protein
MELLLINSIRDLLDDVSIKAIYENTVLKSEDTAKTSITPEISRFAANANMLNKKTITRRLIEE